MKKVRIAGPSYYGESMRRRSNERLNAYTTWPMNSQTKLSYLSAKSQVNRSIFFHREKNGNFSPSQGAVHLPLWCTGSNRQLERLFLAETTQGVKKLTIIRGKSSSDVSSDQKRLQYEGRCHANIKHSKKKELYDAHRGVIIVMTSGSRP